MTRNTEPGMEARYIALKLITNILDDQNSFDDSLANMFSKNTGAYQIDSRDRKFARLLSTTVLRRLGQIDDSLRRCFARPLKSNAKPALNVLRLVAAQILFLDTAPHAAVNAGVEQLQGKKHLRGLTNAVGRRLAKEKQTLLASQDPERLNCPDWLWGSWVTAYGETKTRAIISQFLSEPSIDITVPLDKKEWAKKLNAELLATGTLRRPTGGRIDEFPGYIEGKWWVQDAAAALPVRLFGSVQDRHIADLCSAPGGKTAQLISAGAKVTAIDRSIKRQTLLKKNLDRLNMTAEIVIADILNWFPKESFDGILLDAPCTGTGVIRRHPDIWHLKTPEDVANMTVLQDRLLAAAVRLLKPGRNLVYSTCSLQPEEGECRIESILTNNKSLTRRPIKCDEFPEYSEWITSDGDLRTLPYQLNGLDGFYACRLTRNI